jgi:polyferredoxin
MCIYRLWQFLFKTRDTMHIEYDASRKSECEKCNYCQTQCMVEIDPRDTSFYDSCTNCGACITACDNIHSKSEQGGLLSYKMGKRDGYMEDKTRSVASIKERLSWVLPVWAIGMALFIWGLVSYQPYHLTVYQSEGSHMGQIEEYRVNLASKMLDPADIDISVDGLDAVNYTLSAPSYRFESAGRGDVFIQLHNLPQGLHSFIVRAKANNGWSAHFRIQHFVAGGE